MLDLVDRQVELVAEHYPGTQVVETGGVRLMVVPDILTVAGWNMKKVRIFIAIPSGYPHTNPDCFFTDAALQLESGTEPTNSNIQSVFGGKYRWFSWHLGSWDANSGSLYQYVNFCRRRLQEAR